MAKVLLSDKLPGLSSFLIGCDEQPKNKYAGQMHEMGHIKLDLVKNRSVRNVQVDVDDFEFEEQLAEEIERMES